MALNRGRHKQQRTKWERHGLKRGFHCRMKTRWLLFLPALHNRSSEAAKHKHLTAVITCGLLKTHRPNSKIICDFPPPRTSSRFCASLSNLLDFKVLFEMYFPVKSPPKRLTPATRFPFLSFFFFYFLMKGTEQGARQVQPMSFIKIRWQLISLHKGAVVRVHVFAEERKRRGEVHSFFGACTSGCEEWTGLAHPCRKVLGCHLMAHPPMKQWEEEEKKERKKNTRRLVPLVSSVCMTLIVNPRRKTNPTVLKRASTH